MWLRVSSMSAWSHLPNATQIDRVLASLKEPPDVWQEAWTATRNAAWDASLTEARISAHDVVCDMAGAAYDAVWGAAYDAVWDAVLTVDSVAAYDAVWDATRDAILALIAYDDCDQYLAMSSEQLRAWALLTEHPAAILLLPTVIAFERIADLETV